jgi:hypothetical protein
MASLIYDHIYEHMMNGEVNFGSDTFDVLLVTSSYTPNKGTHDSKSDITNEVTGTGYTAGGASSACTVTLDTSAHHADATFADVSWASSTITARAAVIYKNSGTAGTSWLVAYVDNGSDASSVSATFAFAFTSSFRIQN